MIKNKNKLLKLIISMTGVFVLMVLMFYLSSQNGIQSHRLSRSVLKIFVNLDPNILKIRGNNAHSGIPYDFVIRKIAHFTEYFILSLLIYFVLKGLKIYERKSEFIAVIMCFGFAITDEIHQSFVTGRNPLVMDVFIDLTGSLFAMVVVYNVLKKKRKEMEL